MWMIEKTYESAKIGIYCTVCLENLHEPISLIAGIGLLVIDSIALIWKVLLLLGYVLDVGKVLA